MNARNGRERAEKKRQKKRRKIRTRRQTANHSPPSNIPERTSKIHLMKTHILPIQSNRLTPINLINLPNRSI